MAAAAKIVKRYANRKLYDTERSCYVTLDDIALMIRAGDEVKVVDNKSGEDLTSVTLAQIIFETEKKKSFMPRRALEDRASVSPASQRSNGVSPESRVRSNEARALSTCGSENEPRASGNASAYKR